VSSRKYGKPDANQAAIVKALTAAGCSVLDLKSVGNGCPDLLVTAPVFPHRTLLMEIKDGAKIPSARKLTPDQVDFHRDWRGELHVVNSVDEALAVVTSYCA
jgi:hypothetical protein